MDITNSRGSGTLLFLLFIALLIIGFPYIQDYLDYVSVDNAKHVQGQNQRVAVSMLQSVNDGLRAFYQKEGAYPERLDELIKAKEGEPLVDDQAFRVSGYQWEFLPQPHEYSLRLNPTEDGKYYFFVDESNVVRYHPSVPANAKDAAFPMVRNPGDPVDWATHDARL